MWPLNFWFPNLTIHSPPTLISDNDGSNITLSFCTVVLSSSGQYTKAKFSARKGKEHVFYTFMDMCEITYHCHAEPCRVSFSLSRALVVDNPYHCFPVWVWLRCCTFRRFYTMCFSVVRSYLIPYTSAQLKHVREVRK